MSQPAGMKIRVAQRRRELGLTPAWSQETEEYLGDRFTEREALMMLFYLEAARGGEVFLPGAKKGVQATAYKARGKVMADLRGGFNVPREMLQALQVVTPRVEETGLRFITKVWQGSSWEKELPVIRPAGQTGMTEPAYGNAQVSNNGQVTALVQPAATPPPVPDKLVLTKVFSKDKSVRHLESQGEIESDLDNTLARLEERSSGAARPGFSYPKTNTPLDYMNQMRAKAGITNEPDPSTLLKPSEEGTKTGDIIGEGEGAAVWIDEKDIQKEGQ